MKLNKFKKPILTVAILMAIMSFLSVNSVVADPIVTIDPSQPEALSTVKFTAVIDDEGVTNVDLIIRECTKNQCYLKQIITMSEISDNIYEGVYKLDKSDAIYFNYIIEVETDAGTNTYDDYNNVTYKESSNGDGDSNNTPGFEVIGLFISVMFISFILYRRK